MRKFYSEACEAIYENILANFKMGLISEAELKEIEEDCFLKEGESPKEERMDLMVDPKEGKLVGRHGDLPQGMILRA